MAARSPIARGVAGGLRAQTTTSAPSPRKRAAMPRPMPWVPPVTITTLRDMSNCMADLVGARLGPRALDSVGETCSTLSAPAVQSAAIAAPRASLYRTAMPITHAIDAGIAEVVMNHPPVNALDVA